MINVTIQNGRVAEEDKVRLGSLVSGVVDRITSNAVVVYVNASGFSWGTISSEHLADHLGTNFLCLIKAFLCCFLLIVLLTVATFYAGQANFMKSVLKPGYNFDQLLVLGMFNICSMLFLCICSG